MKYLLAVSVMSLAATGCAGRGVDSQSARGESMSGKVVRVSSLGELQRAVDGAVAGEQIVVAAGTYVAEKGVVVNAAGVKGRPVVVRAERVGDVEIDGKAGIGFGPAAEWVVVQGFVFKHATVTMLLPAGTKHLRVTRNVFALVNDRVKGERPDVEVSGDDCEIDHNTFRDKATEGPMVTVQGPGTSGMAQRTWIHHNYFDNFMPTENNCSAIQIGLSWRSMSSANSLTEYNLFVKCRGENEGAVCNKSCDNVYRYNTFAEETRELSLRHGNRNQVYGNYFLNTDGIRFFGHDDWIFSNYFEGCSPAIHVGNGDATIPPGKLQMHDEPVGAEVVFNTLVDNKINFFMGARHNAYGARDITIANNLVVGGGKAADIRGPLKDSVWAGNVVWGTEAGDIPVGGFVVANPEMRKGADGVWHVGAAGVVRGKAVGGYPVVSVDVEGRKRGGVKDVGAAEVSAGGSGVNGVLAEKDVGPGAE